MVSFFYLFFERDRWSHFVLINLLEISNCFLILFQYIFVANKSVPRSLVTGINIDCFSAIIQSFFIWHDVKKKSIYLYTVSYRNHTNEVVSILFPLSGSKSKGTNLVSDVEWTTPKMGTKWRTNIWVSSQFCFSRKALHLEKDSEVDPLFWRKYKSTERSIIQHRRAYRSVANCKLRLPVRSI